MVRSPELFEGIGRRRTSDDLALEAITASGCSSSERSGKPHRRRSSPGWLGRIPRVANRLNDLQEAPASAALTG